MSHHQDCLPLTHVPPWLYLGSLTVLLLLCMLMAVLQAVSKPMV